MRTLVKALFLLPLMPSLLLAAEVVQRPTLQAGDFWHYQVSHTDWIDYDSRAIRSGEYELYHDGSRLRVFRLGQGIKIEVHGRAEGELPRMLGIFDRPNALLEFPGIACLESLQNVPLHRMMTTGMTVCRKVGFLNCVTLAGQVGTEISM